MRYACINKRLLSILIFFNLLFQICNRFGFCLAPSLRAIFVQVFNRGEPVEAARRDGWELVRGDNFRFLMILVSSWIAGRAVESNSPAVSAHEARLAATVH